MAQEIRATAFRCRRARTPDTLFAAARVFAPRNSGRAVVFPGRRVAGILKQEARMRLPARKTAAAHVLPASQAGFELVICATLCGFFALPHAPFRAWMHQWSPLRPVFVSWHRPLCPPSQSASSVFRRSFCALRSRLPVRIGRPTYHYYTNNTISI